MRNKLVAERYAKAVLLNLKKNEHKIIIKDISSLREILSEDLIKTIDSFLIPQKKRFSMVDEISQELELGKIWRNLFQILVRKHRFIIILEILSNLEFHILEVNNQIKVSLHLARKQSEEITSIIQQKIAKLLKKDVVLNIQITPEIIGGFIAETESMLIDGSIKNNLIKLINISKI